MWSVLPSAPPRLFPYGKSGLKYEDVDSVGEVRRLFPYGKSGLKFVLSMGCMGDSVVSSRMGRVD